MILSQCSSLLLASVLNTTIIFSGQAIDIASTEIVLRNCSNCREFNPLLQNTGVRITFKLTSAALISIMVSRLEKRDKKKARIVTIIFTAIPVALAIRNMGVK